MSPEKDAWDAEALKRALERAADLILSETETLTRADQAIGDGDHGIGMARGFNAVKAALPACEPTVPAVLETVGRTLMLKVGGSSGAIFGTLFMAGSKAVSEAPFDAEGFARFLEAGLEGVQKRGNARPGDKTLVDALAPAAAEARATLHQNGGASLGQCLHAAARAAGDGMERTRGMVATLGRAKTLGERSLGHPDPGAISMTLLLRGLAGAMNEAP
ncbi:MAG: Dak phosphatase [Fibrobacteria bacterium]|jgi:dihydroxyacetone kinase-like protein|nr:Dak phosphatase [Fibrobacteria bacterium]